jgi:hypothetical protein
MLDRFIKRPLSYSQLSAWDYSKEEWYLRYILNKPFGKNSAMNAGNIIGDSIGTEKSLVPDLVPPGIKEFRLTANIGDIYLIGYADHYCPDTKVLHENKTSTNRKKWTQGAVDRHKQLDMYCLMLALTHETAPEDVEIYLNYIPVIEAADMRYYLPDPVEYKQFRTYRTTEQVDAFAKEIQETVEQMHEYIERRKGGDKPVESIAVGDTVEVPA